MKIENLEKRRLYLDLDGVMADFDKHFYDLFGMESRNLDDATLWKLINQQGSFFRDLPVCPGALDFFQAVEHLNPTILTACPKTNYQSAATQKREWVRTHLSTSITVIPMLGGKNKALFMHESGDVLVDDFEKNIKSWQEHGGVGVLHKTFERTRAQLGV
jgi:5'-nucleotidase